MLKISEEIYQNFLSENKVGSSDVVPLEEALLLNPPDYRRGLMLDLLSDDPEAYIGLLWQARMNEDVEVAHYAAAALAELSGEYDDRMQALELAYQADPKNEKVLGEYCDFLGNYIDRGMAQGRMEQLLRKQYSTILKKKLLQKKDFETCVRLAENQLKLRAYAEASKTLAVMERLWPEQEQYWMLKMQYYIVQKQGLSLKKLLEQIEKKQIYLSAAGRAAVAFWKKESQEGKEI